MRKSSGRPSDLDAGGLRGQLQVLLTALLASSATSRRGDCGPGSAPRAGNQLAAKGQRLNVVMMGQGEPLLNLPTSQGHAHPAGPRRLRPQPAPHHALDRRHHPRIEELGREPVRPNSPSSLNASTDEAAAS